MARGRKPTVEKIISGGQTGVDRAALEVALKLGIPHGGWCPRGRKAEDGPIPPQYNLEETPTAEYAVRTEWNVRDSDGTLVIHRGPVSGGTQFTLAMARKHRKPRHAVDLDRCRGRLTNRSKIVTEARAWIRENKVLVLNIAGPRESGHPGIGRDAAAYLEILLG